MLRELKGDLDRVIDAGPYGPPPELVDKAESLFAHMNEPADQPLPPPAAPADVDTAERALGFALPAVLRRVYTEVANGGFGPGYGLVGLPGGWTAEHGESIVELYRTYSDDSFEGEFGAPWPGGLVPVCDLGDGVLACVDTTHPDGRVVAFDFEQIDPDEPDTVADAFREIAPSVEAWLQAWLDEPPPEPVAQTAFVMGPQPDQFFGSGAPLGGPADVAPEEFVSPEEAERIYRQWFEDNGLEPPDDL
jgi:hypothetical protein